MNIILKKNIINFLETRCYFTKEACYANPHTYNRAKRSLIDKIEKELESFSVNHVSREDILYIIDSEEWKGKVTIKDEEIEQICQKMATYYLENGYWEDLRTAARIVLSKKLKSDENHE